MSIPMNSSTIKTGLALILTFCTLLQLPLNAGAKFHVAVGLSYTSGADEVLDAVEERYIMELGVPLDNDFVWPVSLSVNPYVEFDFGLGIGGGIGPASFVIIEERFFGGGGFYTEDVIFNVIVPMGLDARYTFFREGTVSPYVRAGFRYPLVSGDFLDNPQIGPFGAIGVEIWRNKVVGLGFEVAYDGSEIDVVGTSGYRKTLKPNEFLISIFAVF
jgi:hypothetical protein